MTPSTTTSGASVADSSAASGGPFWVLSPVGYGNGRSIPEAYANHRTATEWVADQLRGKARASKLADIEAAAQLWKAPAGFNRFLYTFTGYHWIADDGTQQPFAVADYVGGAPL